MGCIEGLSYYPVAAAVRIDRFGSPGSYSCAVISGREDEPIAFVGFCSSARFANWSLAASSKPGSPPDAQVDNVGFRLAAAAAPAPVPAFGAVETAALLGLLGLTGAWAALRSSTA